MKRVILLAAISAALCGVGLACDDDSGSGDTPDPPEETTENSPPEETPPPEESPPEETNAGDPDAGGGGETAAGEDQTDLECENDDVECPMYDWMEANTLPAVENRDLEALAKALHQIEFMAPDDSWNEGENGWAVISRRGAVAAEEGDFQGARAACKACHTQAPDEDNPYRDRFRKEGRRTAPMPELPEGSETGLPDLEMPAE